MIHAQLDTNGICTGYGNLTNIESAPNLVYLPGGWNEDMKWRKYENGAWSTDKFPPAPPPYEKPVSEEIAELKAENDKLKQRFALMDADFVGFQQFYFEKNPGDA